MNEIMRRALADAMRPLVELVYKLEAKLAGKPHFEWGTVVSAEPLRVKLDSHTTPLPDRPDSLVTGLAEGDRVRVERQGTRVTVHGAGNGADTNWQPLSTAAAYPLAGHGSPPQIRRIGDIVYMRGRVKRSNDSDFGSSTAGYGIATIPAAFRPAHTTRQPLSTTGTAGSIPYAHGEISSATGEFRAWANGATPWLGFDFWWSVKE